MNGRGFVTLCVIWLATAILDHGFVTGAKTVRINAAYNNNEGVVLVSGGEQLQIQSAGGALVEQGVAPLDNHWGSALPPSPDATWRDGGDVMVLKGDMLWRRTVSGLVLGPCPFSDTYSITSWRLQPDPTVQACPPGWTLHCPTGKCFTVYQDPMQWAESVQDCRNKGGDLASINSPQEQQVVNDLIGPDSSYYWIGFTDAAKEGDFTWIHDNSRPTYTHWSNGEPNNYNGNEDCTHIFRMTNGQYWWNDLDCNKRLKRVCMRRAGT